MDMRQNIVISIVIHVTVIILFFSVNFRERESPLPEEYIKVSVIEEMETQALVKSMVYKKGIASPEFTLGSDKRFFIPTYVRNQNNKWQRDYLKQSVDKGDGITEGNREDVTIFVNQHAGISEETNLLYSNTKENESNPPQFPENPPVSPFNKGGQDGGAFNKGGQDGGAFSKREQVGITFSKGEQKGIEWGIGKGQSGDEIPESTKKIASKRDISLYALIRSAIEKAKTYPLLARKRGMEGTVLVSFRIDSKGTPQDVKIIKSSGYRILDEEVPKMLRKASPFPELNGKIVIPITFKLMESASEH